MATQGINAIAIFLLNPSLHLHALCSGCLMELSIPPLSLYSNVSLSAIDYPDYYYYVIVYCYYYTDNACDKWALFIIHLHFC